MKEEVSKSSMKFKCVQTKLFQINNLLQGVSSFIPMSFDREFTSLCVSTIHGSLIDFRFRVKNARLTLGGANEEQINNFMENGILVEPKFCEEEGQPEIKKTPKWYPNNVAEYMFFDEFGFLNINEAKVYGNYTEFTQTLIHVYDNLKALFSKLSQKVVGEEDL